MIVRATAAWNRRMPFAKGAAMKIFGLGIPELVLILVVALLIFGPKNLPKLGGMLGRSVKKLRARTDEKFDDVDEADSKAQPA